MKKILLCLLCMTLTLTASAQLKKVAFASATASSHQGGEGAENAIDGDYSTIWHSNYGGGGFPITFNITLKEKSHVDILRYVPRMSGTNGNWDEVKVEYSQSKVLNKWETLGEYSLGGRSSAYEFEMPDGGIEVARLRIRINSGSGNFASAAEIEAFAFDNTKLEAFLPYFQDSLFTVLKPEVTSSEGIEDADVKALVEQLLADKEGYSKFRVADYEPYRTVESLQAELKTNHPYNQWENPTGIYLKAGESCYVAVSGIGSDKAGLKIKNWLKSEAGSTYSLRNGLNLIAASAEGNVFVDYYTDNFETAPNIKVHFINAPVRGYWDQQTMTNEDWVEMLGKLPNDSSIIIVRSEHAQVAYPVCSWKAYCPTDVDSLMTLYQQVQWAERDILGLKKYGREAKNRQLYFATTYGFMAASSVGAFCHIESLGAIMRPDSKRFDFWGVGHEWGHNNQVKGLHWSGCGETTNNIYASWAQLHFTGNRFNLRLEDEYTGVNDYSGMRGGRMQTYFEEAVRKGVYWQLQDGPDYNGSAPTEKTVDNFDYDGNYIGQVSTTSRNYDHFVKLVPFWQLNLWGTLAGKCPDIIPMVIESMRTTENYLGTYNTNGKQQMNFMKLVCDSAKLDLTPFFEKAGMLKPINSYIEDYGAGWIKISEQMIDNLKKHVAAKGYPSYTEEINYINGHNFHMYRDNMKLEVPKTLGTGCTYSNGKVKVMHSQVKNAVAYETYNAAGEIVRITMFGLGSDEAHSYTQVLYPSSSDEAEAAAYIMAVGYDGTRSKIYEKTNIQKTLTPNKFYTLVSNGKGNALSCGANTSVNTDGNISWSLQRASKSTSPNFVWFLEKRDNKTYLYNPQSNSYFTGSANSATSELCSKEKAPYWEVNCVDENKGTYTFNMNSSGQYINSYNATETGLWSGGSSDGNNIWTVEEVTSIDINILDAGYYLGCYPFALQLPEGLEACVLGEVKEAEFEGNTFTYAVLDKLEGSVVPARLPVVLVGKKGKYSPALVAQDSTTITDTNLLKGTTLKLTNLEKGTLFYNATPSDVAVTTGVVKINANATSVPANRAYLFTTDVNNSTEVYLQVRSIDTGITDVEVIDPTCSEVFYELNGARASKLEKGRVYVTSSGKTILIK